MKNRIINLKKLIKTKKNRLLNKQTKLADNVESKIADVLDSLERTINSIEKVKEIDIKVKLRDGTVINLKKEI